MIGGDFNFVDKPIDTLNTHLFYESETVQTFELLKIKFKLEDSYRINHPNKIVYTFTTHNSGTRLDRIYTSYNITKRNNNSEYIGIPCSDHDLGQKLTLNFKRTIKWGRGKWKLNDSLLTKENIEEYKKLYEGWQKEKMDFNSILQWWEMVKKRTKNFFCYQRKTK